MSLDVSSMSRAELVERRVEAEVRVRSARVLRNNAQRNLLREPSPHREENYERMNRAYNAAVAELNEIQVVFTALREAHAIGKAEDAKRFERAFVDVAKERIPRDLYLELRDAALELLDQ